MSLAIPRQALELWRFASTDPEHQHLVFWRLEATKTKAIAVATNGHILGCYSWQAKDGPQEPLHFSAEAIGNMLKGPTILEDTVLSCAYCRIVCCEEIKFPEWRKAMPKKTAFSDKPFGMNTKYLDIVRQYLNAIDCSSCIRVRSTAVDGAVEFTSEYVSGLTILIMPTKLERNK
jgi:hypothetical protein